MNVWVSRWGDIEVDRKYYKEDRKKEGSHGTIDQQPFNERETWVL